MNPPDPGCVKGGEGNVVGLEEDDSGNSRVKKLSFCLFR